MQHLGEEQARLTLQNYMNSDLTMINVQHNLTKNGVS